MTDNVEVVFTVVASLPDKEDRMEIYGTINPLECVQIDLSADPYGVFLDGTLVDAQVN